jgi:hypothetical protein
VLPKLSTVVAGRVAGGAECSHAVQPWAMLRCGAARGLGARGQDRGPLVRHTWRVYLLETQTPSGHLGDSAGEPPRIANAFDDRSLKRSNPVTLIGVHLDGKQRMLQRSDHHTVTA